MWEGGEWGGGGEIKKKGEREEGFVVFCLGWGGEGGGGEEGGGRGKGGRGGGEEERGKSDNSASGLPYGIGWLDLHRSRARGEREGGLQEERCKYWWSWLGLRILCQHSIISCF